MNTLHPTRSEKELPRRAILALCCFCMSTGNFLMMGPAICLSMMAGDLGLEHEAQKGLLLSAPFWGLGAVTLVSGWLAERLGFRLLLGTSALVQLAGLLLISVAEEPELAMAGGLLGGLGRGLTSAPLTALLCAIYPEGRTRVSNLFHAFYYIGVVFTVVLVLALLHLGWGWRLIFQLFGALVVSYGLVALVLPLPGPARRETETGRLSLRYLIRRPAFGLLLASTFFAGVMEIGPSNWLPYFVEQATGASQALGAIGLLLFAATMAAGRLTVSTLMQRWRVKRYFAVAGLLCAASLLLAALPVGTAFSIFWLAMLGLGVAGIYPTTLAYSGDRFPRAGAPMFALLNGASVFGGVVGPITVGLVADALGLRPAMGLLAIAPVFWLGSLLLIRERGAA